ncbi:hypothetical protein TM7x_02315 [Candidatus Nanosynbacter lyticus]|uniref:VanZ-like domain-containing protein n=1 Tax=Candidatus Nanosynbacter lyticus TaxID=2093824 RepID=A0A6S4GR74_9BACT|nr:hypothetical protein [Candidatus Nanosynbacter lyticus]AJA06520.1 hypothetical protein TM7x_02315 [Candidatus Nanosynbacter lyticus]QCT41598.1 hypothetical protein FBF38_02305 [TM7 phylum sp. oral taxon 952]
MEIFHYISVFVPIALSVIVPYVLRKNGFNVEKKYRWILCLACVLFFISWYLPSPLIGGRDTSFTTHFVGGGLFTGLLWIYLVLVMRWRSRWLVMAFSLFALVSALGCINELAELFMVKFGLASITLDDTNWDILANTLGASAVWIGWLIADFMTKKGRLSGDSRD